MVTIKDVAERSGFDSATVSRALSGKGSVKSKTKEKILSIAKELNYIPNTFAKSLKTNKSNNIAVIMNLEEGFGHYLFNGILSSFALQVEKEGYEITFINKRNDHNKDFLNHCISKRFDGVLLINAENKDNSLTDLINSNIPIVAIDYIIESTEKTKYPVSFITSDNYDGAYNITKYLLQNGHKNIVYITGQDIKVTKYRLKGYKKALSEYNVSYDDNMVINSKYYDSKSTVEAINEVLDNRNPTAIMLPDDYCYMAALNQIRERGLNVPNDISIIGFDGLDIIQNISPKLTTIKQNTKKIGLVAADRLLKIVNDEVKKINYVERIETELLIGNSVKKIN